MRTLTMCNFVSAHHKEGVVHVIDKVTMTDGTHWIDQSIPSQLAAEFMERSTPIFRIAADDALPPTNTLRDFRVACAALGLNVEHIYVIILQGAAAHVYFLWEKDNTVAEIAVIPALVEAQRLDVAHEVLKLKRVALIGCGSLGSKLGVMLARAGVGQFLLVDDDVLLPDNLVRNDLDWRDIGTHKVQALARRMQLVNQAVETKVRRMRRASQERGGAADGSQDDRRMRSDIRRDG